MALFAHAQQMEVEAVRGKFLQLWLIRTRRGFHGHRAQIKTVNILVRNIYVIEQGTACLTLIRICVRDGHITLVAEKDVNARPIDALGWKILALLLCREIQTS